MKVLALDLATRTGLAFGTAGSAPRCATVDLGESQDMRLARMLRLTRDSISRVKPDLVVYEMPVGGSEASAYLIGLASVVIAQATDMGLSPKSLHRGSVRKYFLGRDPKVADFPGMTKGRARSAIKQLVVARCEALGWTVANADEADACALFSFACHKHAGVDLPPPGGLF